MLPSWDRGFRLPQWLELIRELAKPSDLHSASEELNMVNSLLGPDSKPSSRDLEMAAQLLFDALGENEFHKRLSEQLKGKNPKDAMKSRLKHLRGIPFRAIVTTNFDPLIKGAAPSASAYRGLLRPCRPPSPWREAVTRIALGKDPLNYAGREGDSLVMQLHGHIEEPTSLVLTRSQYRHRLYADPAYLTVLRSLLATSTVLFLGYSLTDAYLNELRSELVEVFSSSDDNADPIAWAVIEGVSTVAIQYYKKHEGLGVIPYRAHGSDHGEFDAILKAIFEKTNPVHRLGELLSGQRILWFDPQPDHNLLVHELFQSATKECGERGEDLKKRLVEVTSLEEAWSELENGNKFAVVISHWGHSLYQDRPNGEELLRRLSKSRAEGKHMPPTIIFASGDHEKENRETALSLGAVEFVSRWEDLIEITERLLKRRDVK